VNCLKSIFGGLGISGIMIKRYASILKCDIMVTPFTYLGMSVGEIIEGVIFGMG